MVDRQTPLRLFYLNLTIRAIKKLEKPERCHRFLPLAFVREETSPQLGSECVLFVRSYTFDRCLTRPTIILGMQLAVCTSSRNQYTPEIFYIYVLFQNSNLEEDTPLYLKNQVVFKKILTHKKVFLFRDLKKQWKGTIVIGTIV